MCLQVVTFSRSAVTLVGARAGVKHMAEWSWVFTSRHWHLCSFKSCQPINAADCAHIKKFPELGLKPKAHFLAFQGHLSAQMFREEFWARLICPGSDLWFWGLPPIWQKSAWLSQDSSQAFVSKYFQGPVHRLAESTAQRWDTWLVVSESVHTAHKWHQRICPQFYMRFLWTYELGLRRPNLYTTKVEQTRDVLWLGHPSYSLWPERQGHNRNALTGLDAAQWKHMIPDLLYWISPAINMIGNVCYIIMWQPVTVVPTKFGSVFASWFLLEVQFFESCMFLFCIHVPRFFESNLRVDTTYKKILQVFFAFWREKPFLDIFPQFWTVWSASLHNKKFSPGTVWSLTLFQHCTVQGDHTTIPLVRHCSPSRELQQILVLRTATTKILDPNLSPLRKTSGACLPVVLMRIYDTVMEVQEIAPWAVAHGKNSGWAILDSARGQVQR